MPFDKPRLFPDYGPDRADGADSLSRDCSAGDDLGLSAELELLGAQLRGEADLIADRYAPSVEVRRANPANRRVKRRLLWQAVAVVAAGLALFVWQWERPWGATNRPSEIASGTRSDAARASAKSRPASPSPVELRRTQGIAEVGIDAPVAERHPPANQLEMLRLQLSGFEKVIQKLQTELVASHSAQVESQRQIESLQAEVAGLRKQLNEKQAERHDRQ